VALSAFDDPDLPPAPEAIDAALGRAARHWRKFVAAVVAGHGPLEEQWNWSGAKFGWSLRLREKKRVLVYCTPVRGAFLVGLALGTKAEAAARESGLPSSVVALLDAAPVYAEGRGLRLEVKDAAGVAAALRLVAAKAAN
jgi:hypothetical protein